MNTDPRITELLELATIENITLPYSPEVIIRLEDTGAIVDLHTGAIIVGEADTAYHWQWTPAGEAVAHLLFVEAQR